ncbi:hypothetical protein PANO111632_00540 [Paracoccus nototheniae]
MVLSAIMARALAPGGQALFLPGLAHLIAAMGTIPQDVDHLCAGQTARLRFVGLDLHTTPEVIGIPPDASTDAATGETCFLTRMPIMPPGSGAAGGAGHSAPHADRGLDPRAVAQDHVLSGAASGRPDPARLPGKSIMNTVTPIPRRASPPIGPVARAPVRAGAASAIPPSGNPARDGIACPTGAGSDRAALPWQQTVAPKDHPMTDPIPCTLGHPHMAQPDPVARMRVGAASAPTDHPAAR